MDHTDMFVVAVAAIIFKDSRVLAMKRSKNKDAGPGLWETLSGRIEADEEPVEALKREIDEECGLAVKVDPRPITAYSARRKGFPMVLIVYRAFYEAGDVIISDEHDEYKWVTPDEFAELSSLTRLVDVVYKAADMPQVS